MSFSRPDPSSPASIADASFNTGRRGFDQAEVRDFLRMVAAEFGRLRERERFLERELQAAQADPDLQNARLDDEAMTRLLGEEAMRVLLTARESSNEIREKAEQAAAQLLSEVSDEATRIREEADIEGSRRRSDAAADAEAELAMAKQQGREMVNEARAYRERVLSELARRRELAREQIEQLIHGRDRLMQAFERARLVAVDVVAEMQPLGEPDEYVNLAPTTGPLPVMIANTQRPDDSMAVDDGGTASGDVADAEQGSGESSGELRIVEDATDQNGEVEDEATAADVAESAGDDAAADDVERRADDAVDAEETEVADQVSDAIEPDDAEDDAESGDATADVVQDDVARAVDADDADADETDDEASGDDVVVDLFARLRADTGDGTVVDITPGDAETDDGTERSGTAEAAADRPPAAAADVVGETGDATDEHADADQTGFELRDEVVTPLIVASAKKLKRVLADEQNEVLDALRRTDSVDGLDALVPEAGDHAARYAEAIADELLDAVHAGSATSRPTNRKIRKALATEAVAAADAVLDQWLVAPLRDRLSTCITESAGDTTAVTKKVRAVYREWKTQHIDETLDDIVRTAHGRGVLAGFAAGTPIVWEVDERLPACPDCDDNALAGAVGAGDEFPTGHTFAPAHPGCRCLLAAADG